MAKKVQRQNIKASPANVGVALINAILLNVKINQPELVDTCGYELATNQKNFTERYLAEGKMSQIVLGGATFLIRCDLLYL